MKPNSILPSGRSSILDIESLRPRIVSLPTDELRRIVTKESSDYRAEVIKLAEEELQRRKEAQVAKADGIEGATSCEADSGGTAPQKVARGSVASKGVPPAKRAIAVLLFIFGAVLATAGSKSAASVIGAVLFLFIGVLVFGLGVSLWKKGRLL